MSIEKYHIFLKNCFSNKSSDRVEELFLFHFFMSRYFRIIVAEMALAVFLSNIFIPSLVWADEMTDSGSSSIVQESLPIEPVEIVPTDSGALISDISDSTGETLETNTGFTDTGSLIS